MVVSCSCLHDQVIHLPMKLLYVIYFFKVHAVEHLNEVKSFIVFNFLELLTAVNVSYHEIFNKTQTLI